jgi:hypothetical protein
VRAAKPNGVGMTVGYGTESFRLTGIPGSATEQLGTLGLRTISGGVFYARRPGPFEISAGVSGGYGFGVFTLTDEARDSYARSGLFDIRTDATNGWVIKPNASLWYNLTSRVALSVSGAYVTARPRIRITGGLPERTVDASAVQFTTGVGFKVF